MQEYIQNLKQFFVIHSFLYLALNSLQCPASIFEPVYNEKGDDLYLEDQLSEKKDLDNDDLISLNNALKNIKERERRIVIQRYIIGKTQSELANELSISQAQISRLEKSGIDNIKKLII